MHRGERQLEQEDEEALAHAFSPSSRKEQGRYFTPASLVETVLDRVAALVPDSCPGGRGVRVVDPSCGAGAFLAPAERRFPQATLHGLELEANSAAHARARVRGARIEVGDALRGGFERLCAGLPPGRFELWVGNPPYNGSSPLLRDPAAYASLLTRLEAAGARIELPRGTSLRDDFAFFLLLCATRLQEREGVLALVTPSTLLDAYLYAGLRRWLLERLTLVEVMDLGGGVFRDARVKTCVTVWRSGVPVHPSAFIPSVETRSVSESRDGNDGTGPGTAVLGPSALPLDSGTAALASVPTLGVNAVGGMNAVYRRRVDANLPLASSAPDFLPGLPFTPASPEHSLRPPPAEATALDEAWRVEGEPLTTLIPISLPGLKTRFDELLTDADPDRLFRRVSAFLSLASADTGSLDAFAREWSLPEATWPKLGALHASLPPGHRARREHVRPFLRYAGARHAAGLPPEARAYCYLDRALIPRGDHRLRGAYDPHHGPVKLVFNVRELPLSALLVEEDGCIHDHRHARFAPLLVPERIHASGLEVTRSADSLGPLVPNLSEWGRARSDALAGGPRELFARVARFIRSREVQDVWAKAFGASRILPIPKSALSP